MSQISDNDAADKKALITQLSLGFGFVFFFTLCVFSSLMIDSLAASESVSFEETCTAESGCQGYEAWHEWYENQE